MKVLVTAKSFGFGSTSKAATLSALLPQDYRVFAGSGVALAFAQLNHRCFSEVRYCEVETGSELSALLSQTDWLVSARNGETAFWARRRGIHCFYVDSLLPFWATTRSIAGLARQVDAWSSLSDDAAWAQFQGLTVHERALAGHLLATRSVAQRFPGADERAKQLRAAGAVVDVCGSIIEPLAPAAQDGTLTWDIVVNLGGFDNFELRSQGESPYLALVERWVSDYLEEDLHAGDVLVCGGAFRRPRRLDACGRSARFEMLERDTLIDAIAHSRVYLCTPGLTAVHEAMALGIVPVLLPEEHRGHLFNATGLAAAGLGPATISFTGILPDLRVPDDDVEGTRALVAAARRVLHLPEAYRRFQTLLNERMCTIAALTRADQARIVDNLRSLLDGPSFASVLQEARWEVAARLGKGSVP